MRYPLDPWESIFIVDADRAANGLPVYEPLATGHATHMYGPLGTYTMAAIFKVTGPSVRVGRWISVLSGLAATLLFTVLFVSRRKVVYLFIGAALFLSLHIRCMGLFTNTRPDITAFLLASIALIIAYYAQEKRWIWLYAISAGLIVIAFLFKQTYAVAALVPPLALLVLKPQGWTKLAAASFIPLAAMMVTALVLKVGFPLVWFYAIDVPKQYRIFGSRVNLGVMSLFMNNPLYLAMVVLLAFHVGFSPRKDPKLAWLLITMVIGGLMGIVAFAKQGGNYNSMLMVYAPMTAFCMLMLPATIDLLVNLDLSKPMLAFTGVTMAMLLATTTFGIPMSGRLASTHASNTSDYSKVIAAAKKLDGKLLCPEEPTISLFARGEHQKNLSAEIEAMGNGYRDTVRKWMDQNTRDATWIVTVSTADMPGRLSALMPELGYVRVTQRGIGSEYVFWRKRSPEPTTTPSR